MELTLLLLALVSPLLYAASNHIDNILLEKYFKEGGVGTLLLFSAVLSFLALPVLLVLEPAMLAVDAMSLLFLLGVGCLNTLLLWCYLQALFSDEPTVVIIYYQLVPVIGLFFGYVILGEVITEGQALAMILIIAGASVLSIALDEAGKIVFRARTAVYMLIASTCWALESTLFKLVALEENVWRSLFWEHVALVGIGFLLFALVPHYRDSFKKALRSNSKPVLGLNVVNESLYILGNSIAAYVVILIPVSMTLLMNSVQPLFVLLLGMLLWVVFPNLGVEYVSKRNWPQKIAAIVLTSIGIIMLG
jgi:drug/metabolite transporter (DMT)-like permease